MNSSYVEMKKAQHIKIKQIQSFYSTAAFGNEKFFKPRWFPEYAISDPEYFTPKKWTYLYHHQPLIKTLERYVDYDKLKPGENSNPRLILTAVSVLDSKAFNI